jgi:hypothetical protein
LSIQQTSSSTNTATTSSASSASVSTSSSSDPISTTIESSTVEEEVVTLTQPKSSTSTSAFATSSDPIFDSDSTTLFAPASDFRNSNISLKWLDMFNLYATVEATPMGVSTAEDQSLFLGRTIANSILPMPLELTTAEEDVTSTIIPTRCRLLFLGCDAPAGNGTGFDYSNSVSTLLKKHHPAIEVTYVKSETWMLWKPHEYKIKLTNKYDVILIWATLQDILEDIAVPFTAYDQWLDVLYNAHKCIIPSRAVLEWTESKMYLVDLHHFTLPNTRFITSPHDINPAADNFPLHLKTPFASCGRLHHIATTSNTLETEKFASNILNDLRRWCVISQPEIRPFTENKRVVVSKEDSDPIAQAVWRAAAEKGLVLGWFRLDTVIFQGKQYLNEITRCNPAMTLSGEKRAVCDATADMILEAFKTTIPFGSNDDYPSRFDCIQEFEFMKLMLNTPSQRACRRNQSYVVGAHLKVPPAVKKQSHHVEKRACRRNADSGTSEYDDYYDENDCNDHNNNVSGDDDNTAVDEATATSTDYDYDEYDNDDNDCNDGFDYLDEYCFADDNDVGSNDDCNDNDEDNDVGDNGDDDNVDYKVDFLGSEGSNAFKFRNRNNRYADADDDDHDDNTAVDEATATSTDYDNDKYDNDDNDYNDGFNHIDEYCFADDNDAGSNDDWHENDEDNDVGDDGDDGDDDAVDYKGSNAFKFRNRNYRYSAAADDDDDFHGSERSNAYKFRHRNNRLQAFSIADNDDEDDVDDANYDDDDDDTNAVEDAVATATSTAIADYDYDDEYDYTYEGSSLNSYQSLYTPLPDRLNLNSDFASNKSNSGITSLRARSADRSFFMLRKKRELMTNSATPDMNSTISVLEEPYLSVGNIQIQLDTTLLDLNASLSSLSNTQVIKEPSLHSVSNTTCMISKLNQVDNSNLAAEFRKLDIVGCIGNIIHNILLACRCLSLVMLNIN